MNMNGNDAKCLIAYFSRPGNNYVNGQIVNLPVGNTEVAAKMIREMTGGDLFQYRSSECVSCGLYGNHRGCTAGTSHQCPAEAYRPRGNHGIL